MEGNTFISTVNCRWAANRSPALQHPHRQALSHSTYCQIDAVGSFSGGKVTGKTVWWIPCHVIIPASYQLQRNVAITTEISGFSSGAPFCYLQVSVCGKILYLFVERYCICSEAELSQLIPAGTILCHFSSCPIVVFSFHNVIVMFVLKSYTPYWPPFVTFITISPPPCHHIFGGTSWFSLLVVAIA